MYSVQAPPTQLGVKSRSYQGETMEIFAGFAVIIWIAGFFLTILWLITPFIIFSMKGKIDQTYTLVESINIRLANIEQEIKQIKQPEPKPSEGQINEHHLEIDAGQD
jgi:hypothetical protein